jgi:hypothetical protein
MISFALMVILETILLLAIPHAALGRGAWLELHRGQEQGTGYHTSHGLHYRVPPLMAGITFGPRHQLLLNGTWQAIASS